jgi:predicted enzyme related to lactoylglutathione lyase
MPGMGRPRFEFVIDCADPWALVEFWETALSYSRHPEANGNPYLAVVPPAGEPGPVVILQRVPEPKVVKNRAHLDLYVSDPESLIERLVECGGTRSGAPQEYEGQWFQVMLDPEGNEFCVLQEWVPELLDA